MSSQPHRPSRAEVKQLSTEIDAAVGATKTAKDDHMDKQYLKRMIAMHYVLSQPKWTRGEPFAQSVETVEELLDLYASGAIDATQVGCLLQTQQVTSESSQPSKS